PRIESFGARRVSVALAFYDYARWHAATPERPARSGRGQGTGDKRRRLCRSRRSTGAGSRSRSLGRRRRDMRWAYLGTEPGEPVLAQYGEKFEAIKAAASY